MRQQLLVILLISLSFPSCRVFRLGQFYLSENHQRPKSPKHVITASYDSPFYFHSGDPTYQQRIGQLSYPVRNPKNGKKKADYTLEEYLDKETKTSAFLVIRNDTLLYEKYFEGYDQETRLPSFSVAKSFTSALVGIAVEEGKIESVQDPVTKYLPELTPLDSNWDQLTIEHLLNMRSGIKFNEENYVNPYSSIADLYISHNIFRQVKKAKFIHPPGTRRYYSSLDTEILGVVLERALQRPIAEYLEEKIWGPCGMESPATWDMDSKKNRVTKVFCCLNVVARDYAKFGRLYLNQGNWNGVQVVPKEWVRKSILPNFDNGCYQYQWYSGGKTYKFQSKEDNPEEYQPYPDSLTAAKAITLPDHQRVVQYRGKENNWAIRVCCGPNFYAVGIFGQEIYVVPEENLIFVRLGKKWDTPTRSMYRMIIRRN